MEITETFLARGGTPETAEPTQAHLRYTACRARIRARDNDTSALNASPHWAGLDE